jgi:hypothetical protein
MKSKMTSLTGLALVLLLASACGSAGGGLGDILGGGGSPSTQSGTLRGRVDHVDTRSIYLTDVNGYSSRLANGSSGGGTARVFFDDRTTVEYQGRAYRAADLERGDEVEMRVSESSNRELFAETVTVLRDVSAGGSTSYPSGNYGTNIRGMVRYVDTNRRTIEVDRGQGYGTAIVEYDTRTAVLYGNRTYNPADIQRNDEVDIRVTDLGNNRWLAQDINIVRSASGSSSSGTYGNQNSGTVRGTVRYVDTSRRTIELDQTNGSGGFMGGSGSGGTMIVSYGSNSVVEVNGRGENIANLERGDIIDVTVDRSGSSYFANRIILVRDVNSR